MGVLFFTVIPYALRDSLVIRNWLKVVTNLVDP